MNMLRNRLPSLPELLRVASVVAIFFYGWTIMAWIWQLPSWMLSLNLGELLPLFAYDVVSALSETLTLLVLLLLLTFILPPHLLRDHFGIRATWLTLGLLSPMLVFFLIYRTHSAQITPYLLPWTFGTLLLAALLAFLSSRVGAMRSMAIWLSDQLQVFLFILVPLTGISLITVLIRNIFQ